MDLKDILSIAGKPGLYKNIAQAKNGVIIESLTDGKRSQAFANDKISSLGEISVFTESDDMPLREVFRLMQEKLAGTAAPDSKADDKSLVAFFNEVLPQYDKERVYTSHIRKMITWYNLLIQNGITDFTEPVEENVENVQEKEVVSATAVEVEKPEKVTKAKTPKSKS